MSGRARSSFADGGSKGSSFGGMKTISKYTPTSHPLFDKIRKAHLIKTGLIFGLHLSIGTHGKY